MQDDESMTSLAERTAETNEDIEERTALANAISELDEATEETAEQGIELDE
jgi:hypothetical protein